MMDSPASFPQIPMSASSSDSSFPTAACDVVVTGVGIVTSLGLGWRVNADGFRTGRVALREVTLFDTSRQHTHTAGQVELPAQLPATRLSAREISRLERGGRLLIHATDEALRMAELEASQRAMPLVLGTSAGAMAHGEAFYAAALAGGSRRGQAQRAAHYLISQQVAAVGRAFGVEGPTTVLSNACASGANALGHAAHLLRSGRAERVLAGGYDALSHLVFAGFDSLRALSPTLPRPFDAQRDGLALGEGAAMFVLETRAAAEARGVRILGCLAGYGLATDVHHLTQPHPTGQAAVQAMRMASADAGVQPADVHYVNSHGTGTPLNDPAEAAAIATWAGDAVAALPVSSTKGNIGHLLGGAGAVEAAVCLMAMQESFLPPTTNVRTPDPACTFALITQPRAASVRVALTNSFGFGGSNATLIFRL